jgi:hypothetical protein
MSAHDTQHCLYLLEAGNKTFADIRRMLVNPEFCTQVLNSIAEFWESDSANAQASQTATNLISKHALGCHVVNVCAAVIVQPEVHLGVIRGRVPDDVRGASYGDPDDIPVANVDNFSCRPLLCPCEWKI